MEADDPPQQLTRKGVIIWGLVFIFIVFALLQMWLSTNNDPCFKIYGSGWSKGTHNPYSVDQRADMTLDIKPGQPTCYNDGLNNYQPMP